MDPRIDALRSSLPNPISGFTHPDTPTDRRLLAAGAALPMPPEVLIKVLAIMVSDPDKDVRDRARATLDEQSMQLIRYQLSESDDGSLIELMGEYYLGKQDEDMLTMLLSNKAAPDSLVEMIAGKASARLTEVIVTNQVRMIRAPMIIKALYFNPNTPMAVVTRAVETAVRNDVDLSHIPGAEQIKASILGPAAGEAVAAEEEEASPEQDQQLFREAIETLEGTAAVDFDPANAGEAEFMQMLMDASNEESLASALQDSMGFDEDSLKKRSLYEIVRAMSVAQKVRLAITGSLSARKLLIRDAKSLVAISVLDSPRLTDREVVEYAHNKTLSDDVIRRIAYNRDWSRMASVQKALVGNPKCPPQKAMEFVRNLPLRELKAVAKDRDVPAHLSRQAQGLVAKRERRLTG
jgi:hypothetical protein